MKTQGLSPSQLPGALSGPGEPGWKDRVAGLLEKECGWVLKLPKVLGRTSRTEQLFKLYRFLVVGIDEDGFWKAFVLSFGRITPEQLDSFVNEFTELKQKSVERVTATCWKIYNAPLARASDLPVRFPGRLARTTVKRALEGVKATDREIENIKEVIDFSWLYTVLHSEIETFAIVMGMTGREAEGMLNCLFECG